MLRKLLQYTILSAKGVLFRHKQQEGLQAASRKDLGVAQQCFGDLLGHSSQARSRLGNLQELPGRRGRLDPCAGSSVTPKCSKKAELSGPETHCSSSFTQHLALRHAGALPWPRPIHLVCKEQTHEKQQAVSPKLRVKPAT